MMRVTIEFWQVNTKYTTGMCSAGSALTVVHLRAAAGVPSLVLSIDKLGTVTPHLGYEPKRLECDALPHFWNRKKGLKTGEVDTDTGIGIAWIAKSSRLANIADDI